MQHCGGGPGATSFGQDEAAPRSDPQHDIFAALIAWVEKGDAPTTIVATKYKETDPAKDIHPHAEMTRPLCPYPKTAQYKGSGDRNSAKSFVCAPEGN
jgi:feruloyl esterase